MALVVPSTDGPLCPELILYAVKKARDTEPTMRRATRRRIQQAAEDILRLSHRAHVGEIAGKHWAMPAHILHVLQISLQCSRDASLMRLNSYLGCPSLIYTPK